MDMGDKLRALRREKKLTQEQLAVYRQLPEHASHADELQRLFDADELLDCFF